MYKTITIALLGLLAGVCTNAWAAEAIPAEGPNANDPTVTQVYDAARAGHLAQAQQMMTLVLANHPHSARAHYVAAEIDADAKNYGEARQELKTAEDIDPGLPFATPQAVAALRREIGESPGAQAAPARAPFAAPVVARPAGKPFPWTMVWVIAAVVFVLWLLFRRRSTPAVYGAPGAGTMSPPGGYPQGGYPNVVAGGSGILGGLASGLAVGAGIAAGEELVHGFENRHDGSGAPIAPGSNEPPANSDLGGADFGISDPGGGWDVGGGGGSSGDDGGGWT